MHSDPESIDGVQLIDLKPNQDPRGAVTEIYRKSWTAERQAVQLNHSFAKGGTLRGLHTHLRQWDYIVNIRGGMRFALVDFREKSPTFMATVMFDLSAEELQAIIIPPGVGHGFYFETDSAYLLLVDNYYDGTDQIRCRFDAPELGLEWPVTDPVLSDKDRDCGGVQPTLEAIRGAEK